MKHGIGVRACVLAAILALCSAGVRAQEVVTQTPPTGTAQCAYTNFGCLRAAEERTSAKPESWVGESDVQKSFLKVYAANRGDLEKLNDVLTSTAGTVDEVNSRLKSAGFPDLQLHKLAGVNFATVSLLNWKSQWAHRGSKTTIKGANGVEYAGAKLSRGVKFYAADGDAVVAEIATINGDRFFLAQTTGAVKPNAEAVRLFNSLKPLGDVYDGLSFPKAAVRTKTSNSYLVGIRNTGRDGQPVQIMEAVQEVRMALDEIGAEASSASAMSVGKGVRLTKSLVIDGPFVAWIVRKGCGCPVAAGYADYGNFTPVGTPTTTTANAPAAKPATAEDLTTQLIAAGEIKPAEGPLTTSVRKKDAPAPAGDNSVLTAPADPAPTAVVTIKVNEPCGSGTAPAPPAPWTVSVHGVTNWIVNGKVLLRGTTFTIPVKGATGESREIAANVNQMSAILADFQTEDTADLSGKTIEHEVSGAPAGYNALSVSAQERAIARAKVKAQAALRLIPLLATEIVSEGGAANPFLFTSEGIPNSIVTELLEEQLGENTFMEGLQQAVFAAGSGTNRKVIYPATPRAWKGEKPAGPFIVFRMMNGKEDLLCLLQTETPFIVPAWQVRR